MAALVLSAPRPATLLFEQGLAATLTLGNEEHGVLVIKATPASFAVEAPLEATLVFKAEAVQGAAGAPGAPGIQGPPGIAGYTHTQGAASAAWTIAHNLGHRPILAVRSVGGVDVAPPEVTHLSVNTCRLDFDVPFAGEAFLI